MKQKFWLAAAGAVLLLSLCLTACVPANEAATASSQAEPEAAGTVYLYGEEHAKEELIQQELELWENLYAAGARNLFLEDGYASAQLLNRWMQAEDDTLLNEHFKAVQGTLGGSEVYRTFYEQIKQNCPETVFHGTDIEHQYRAPVSGTGVSVFDLSDGRWQKRFAGVCTGAGKHPAGKAVL